MESGLYKEDISPNEKRLRDIAQRHNINAESFPDLSRMINMYVSPTTFVFIMDEVRGIDPQQREFLKP